MSELRGEIDAKASLDQLTSGLAGKEDTIAEGGLAQSNVAGLVADLAAKATADTLAETSANLTQAIVPSQTTPEAELDKKANSTELKDAIATRHPTIGLGGLAQDRVANLTQDLAAKQGTLGNRPRTGAALLTL